MVENSGELAQKLSQLGLNTYEIKVLVTLYNHAEVMKADEIAELAEIPLARTYEALDLLEHKKFILVHQGRPRQYTAEEPEFAISQYISDRESSVLDRLEQTKRLASEVLDLAQDLFIQHHTQIEPEDLMQQFTRLEDAEFHTLKLIREANEEILIFSHVFHWYLKVKDDLKAAIDRGCKVKVLMQTDITERVDPEQLIDVGIEVRSITGEGIKTRGTLVDQKSVVFVIWADDEFRVGGDKRVYRPQYSSNPGIIEVFYGYFNHLWEQS